MSFIDKFYVARSPQPDEHEPHFAGSARCSSATKERSRDECSLDVQETSESTTFFVSATSTSLGSEGVGASLRSSAGGPSAVRPPRNSPRAVVRSIFFALRTIQRNLCPVHTNLHEPTTCIVG
jgi:hypothetical protein